MWRLHLDCFCLCPCPLPSPPFSPVVPWWLLKLSKLRCPMQCLVRFCLTPEERYFQKLPWGACTTLRWVSLRLWLADLAYAPSFGVKRAIPLPPRQPSALNSCKSFTSLLSQTRYAVLSPFLADPSLPLWSSSAYPTFSRSLLVPSQHHGTSGCSARGRGVSSCRSCRDALPSSPPVGHPCSAPMPREPHQWMGISRVYGSSSSSLRHSPAITDCIHGFATRHKSDALGSA